MGIITKAYPIGNGAPLDPLKQGVAYKYNFDFTQGANLTLQLAIDSTTGLDNVQSVFIDNSNSSAAFYMVVAITNELIVCPPYSQGFFPVLYPKGSNLNCTARSTGGVAVPVQFLNMPFDLNIWNVTSPVIAGTQQVAGTVLVQPLLAGWINRSGAITTGGTSQSLMNANGTRKRIYIRNPATANGQNIGGGNIEAMYFNFGAAAGVEDGYSFELLPGESYDTALGPLSSEALFINAATAGHRYIARELV